VLFSVFKQADRCFIILRDENNQLIPKVIKARRANTETTTRFSKTIVRKVLDGLESIISEDASSDSNIGTAQSIAEFRIRSVMCVPLVSNENKGIGVIQLDTQERSKKFTRDDLQLLIAVSHQAGVALENVRMQESLLTKTKLERDVDLARRVQASFLPRTTPTVLGYEFFAHYESAQQVGGDYYDFIDLPGGKIAIPLGDVAGKGVPAALFMAKSTTETRFSLLAEPDPASALAKLNDVLTPLACELDRFVTLALAILDPATHEVIVLNAAQMLPMLYRGTAGTLEYAISDDDTGLMLGAMEGLTYNSRKLTLEPGDSILLFSDGVPDALSPAKEPFTLDGVFKCAQPTMPGEVYSPKQLGQRIISAVKRHSASEPQFDDTTMVVFGRVLDAAPATVPPGEKTVKLQIGRPTKPAN
jgi:serine phosphatase RsbU (regulator of sigma subunit)